MMPLWICRLFGLFLFPALAFSQGTSIAFSQPANCAADQFYNTASLSCVSCGSSVGVMASPDRLRCTCAKDNAISDLGSPLVNCTQCAIDQVVSFNQRECLSCTGSTCTCGAQQIRAENLSSNTYSCADCGALSVPNDIGNQCILCQQTFISSNCVCPESNQSGGLCFPQAATVYSMASAWETLYLESSYQACRIYSNITACQLLTNLVILNVTSLASTPLNLYSLIYLSQNKFLPPLFYSTSSAQLWNTAPSPAQLSFTRNVQMQFKLLKYDIRGNFLGWQDLRGGTLQMCPNTQAVWDAAFRFGTFYRLSCTLQVADLLQNVPEPVFYELFVSYTSNGVSMVWPVPVWNAGFQGSTNPISSSSTNALRRFFLVDGISGRTGNISNPPAYVTVATSLNLSVYVTTGNTWDQSPFQLTVQYQKIPGISGTAQVSFAVTYSQSQGTYKRDTDIALGVLGSLASLYAILETSSWLRRSGQQYIGILVLIKFLAFLSGALANTFFLITLGTAIYWLIAFKGQTSVVHVTLPPAGGQIESDFIIYLSVAFALKTVELLHLLVSQLTVSMFLVDWEKPKEKITSNSQGKSNVSIWRTILVANEWNEMQTYRKISPIFQLFSVLLLLEVVGLKNITAKDLNLDLNPPSGTYLASWSIILRFGIAASMWLAVGIVQILFCVVIYERFFEDKMRQFTDLCSLSNVSIFILTHRCYGYYIHGRSVHGQADVSMETMLSNLKKEEENLCPLRGLEPSSDIQTFEVLLSDRVRDQYEKIMEPLLETPRGQRGSTESNPLMQQRIKTYYTINRFLSSFLDHVYKEIDYVVKDKLFLEHILDMEFQQPMEKSILYSDDSARFSRTLFYGNELVLLLFDTLLFCIIDLGTQNFVLATIITYVVQMLVEILRYQIGKKNVSRQTMVEENFLI
ncbi:meckelin [Xenopus laevis]|uniref:Meckelin n=2 Tax=Xenopus laevis TaxID=8355 RepID=A0A1L8GL09_XENLA|nr:meckelin [Xenopus laevis]OCT84534.1 hypothetical protein XELAEV_18022687mg [Xenopus laevis]